MLEGRETTYDTTGNPVLIARTNYCGDAYRFQADLHRPVVVRRSAPRTLRIGYGAAVVGFLPLPGPRLADAVIVLRPWRAEDASAMLSAFRDPWFLRFSDWAPATLEATRAWQANSEQARQRGSRIELAVAAAADSDDVLGGVSLHGVEREEGRAAVGYWLLPGSRGRGAATRGVKLIARWAFEDLCLARLELTCGPDNHASQRVAERCGFTREGLLRSHLPFKGRRRDSVIFGLLPDELIGPPSR